MEGKVLGKLPLAPSQADPRGKVLAKFSGSQNKPDRNLGKRVVRRREAEDSIRGVADNPNASCATWVELPKKEPK